MELNDIEKDWTPSPKFYIWGVPNRGKEVAKLIQDKGVDVCEVKDKEYTNSNILIYEDEGSILSIDKRRSPSLCSLITSNWVELKLPYKPKDKELVWAWNDEERCARTLLFYDAKNESTFDNKGIRDDWSYDNYALFEGEYPKWAEKALVILDE